MEQWNISVQPANEAVEGELVHVSTVVAAYQDGLIELYFCHLEA